MKCPLCGVDHAARRAARIAAIEKIGKALTK